MSNGQNKIISSFIWKFLEQIAIQLIGIVFQIILARLLDPKDFGNLAILITFTNFALIFIQSGISVALIQKKNLEDYDIFSVLFICVLIASIFYVVLFFTAPLIAGFYEEPDLVLPLRILAIVLFIGAINSIQIALLTRAYRFKAMFICNLLASVLAGVIGIVLAVKGFGIWALVLHTLLNRAIVTFLMFFFIRIKIKVGFSGKSIKSIFSFSIKILGANLISGAYDSFRTLIIGKKYSKEQLGYYDKAYTYSSYISQISSNCLSGVLLPVFSEKQDNLFELKELARKSVQLTAFLMFPVFVGIAVVAKPLIIILLTEKWSGCISFLIVFCILRIPGSITQIDRQVLYSLKRGGICLIYEIVILLLNIAAIFAFINLGIIYVALAALIIEFIGLAIYSVISMKVYGYSIKQRILDLMRPILNTCLMAGIIYPISLVPIAGAWILLLQIIFGIAIYTALAYFIDRKTFKYFVNKAKNLFKGNRTNVAQVNSSTELTETPTSSDSVEIQSNEEDIKSNEEDD